MRTTSTTARAKRDNSGGGGDDKNKKFDDIVLEERRGAKADVVPAAAAAGDVDNDDSDGGGSRTVLSVSCVVSFLSTHQHRTSASATTRQRSRRKSRRRRSGVLYLLVVTAATCTFFGLLYARFSMLASYHRRHYDNDSDDDDNNNMLGGNGYEDDDDGTIIANPDSSSSSSSSVPFEVEELRVGALKTLASKKIGRRIRIRGGIGGSGDDDETKQSSCPSVYDDDDDGTVANTNTTLRTTLVVQTTLDRFWILEETCLRWNRDPIIAVVSVPPPPPLSFGGGARNRIQNSVDEQLVNRWSRKTTCRHMTVVEYRLTERQFREPTQYPINALRNVGLRHVETSHVLVIDVDFIPSQNLDRTLRKVLLLSEQQQRQHDQAGIGSGRSEPIALVVPAFERHDVPTLGMDGILSSPRQKGRARSSSSNYKYQGDNSGGNDNAEGSTTAENGSNRKPPPTRMSTHGYMTKAIPRTLQQLRQCYAAKQCTSFDRKRNPQGHASTRTDQWLELDTMGEPGYYYDIDNAKLQQQGEAGIGNSSTGVFLNAGPLMSDKLRARIQRMNGVLIGASNGTNITSTAITARRRLGTIEDDQVVTAGGGSGDKSMRSIQYIPCIRSQDEKYEPYMVLRWCGGDDSNENIRRRTQQQQSPPQPLAPYYDERFVGYGKNKVALASHLRYAGYRFAVVPPGASAFLVHNPHDISKAKTEWRNSTEIKSSMNELYQVFLDELKRKYRHKLDTIVPLCPVDECDSEMRIGARGTWSPVEGSYTHARRTLETLVKDPTTYYRGSCITYLGRGKCIHTTLVLVCKYDQLWVVEKTARRWKDPIIVVYERREIEHDFDEDTELRMANWESKYPQLLLIEVGPEGDYSSKGLRKNGRRYSAVEDGDEGDGAYPVNTLRNIGLAAVRTSHVLVADADFIPSDSLDETIRKVLQERRQYRLQLAHQVRSRNEVDDFPFEHREALIVPAFERKRWETCQDKVDCRKKGLSRLSSWIPRDFGELRECIANATSGCSIIRPASSRRVSAQSTAATATDTAIERWMRGDWYERGDVLTRNVRSIPANDICVDRNRNNATATATSTSMSPNRPSRRYKLPPIVMPWCPSSVVEPAETFLVGITKKGRRNRRRLRVPLYDERFRIFDGEFVGGDISDGDSSAVESYYEHARHAGYGMLVLPDGFFVRNPYANRTSSRVGKSNDDDDGAGGIRRRRLQYPMDRFLEELRVTYKSHSCALS